LIGLKNSSTNIIPKNNVIVGTRVGVGKVAVNLLDIAINQDLTGIVVNKSLLKPIFLVWYFNSPKVKNRMESFSRGTTIKGITQSNLKRILIPLPPLAEQQKIAEILGTVDEAIEKVDKTIEKTERLKKGLMQELLTKGIPVGRQYVVGGRQGKEDGRRYVVGGRQGKEKREFKDTKIGRIPNEWEVVKLGNKKLFEITMGSSPPSSTYNSKKIGVSFLQGNAEFGEKFPNPIKYCSAPQKITDKGSVLISVRAPVGDINMADQEYCIGRGVASVQLKKDSFNSDFLFYFLKFSKRRFERYSLGSTFKAIRRKEVDNFKVFKPNISEQKKIVEILSTVDKKIDMEKKRKEKLERTKKGLMQDLLTGRKRVKV